MRRYRKLTHSAASGPLTPSSGPLPSGNMVEPKVIQARLGHAAITETMDTYGFTSSPDAEDLGHGAIDAIFAVALTEQERNQETW